jgi:hypothetical protein
LDKSLSGVASTHLTLGTPSASALESGPYQAGYGADSNANTKTVTVDGRGQWWKVALGGNEAFGNQYKVEKVRILNPNDNYNDRLAGTIVTVNGVRCGTVQANTAKNTWYWVTCGSPLLGNEVKLESALETYIQLSGIQVYGWAYDQYEDVFSIDSDGYVNFDENSYIWGGDISVKIKAVTQEATYY